MSAKICEVFGLKVHCFEGLEQAADDIVNMAGSQCVMLTALNPEKILTARRSEEVNAILQSSDVLYADGIGVVKAIRGKHGLKVNRVPGCELWEKLVEAFTRDGKSIFMVGASKEVNAQAVEKVVSQYGAQVVGARDGFFDDEDQLIEEIKASGASFVSVALGSPRQERFIFKCKAQGVQAVMMGVGGTYDVYTGNVKRAPKVWCNLGLEWLYRLLNQPSRIGRQLKLVGFAWDLVLRRY